MKRDPMFQEDIDAKATVDMWGSGAAATFDDATWDEMSDHSPPQSPALASPMDFRYSVSPVNSSDSRIFTSDQSAINPICDDESPAGQGSLLLVDARDNFDLGFDARTGYGVSQLPPSRTLSSMAPSEAVRTVSGPVANASTMQVKCGKGAGQAMEMTQLSSDSALARRRQKNREHMRKARQKQREEMRDLKRMVEQLEKQYAILSLHSSTAVDSVSTSLRAAVSYDNYVTLVTRMAAEYTRACELTRRLGAENYYLKVELQRQTAWEFNLSRVLQSSIAVDGPRWAQQFQQPSLGGEEVLRMQLDKMDELDASEELGYHALSDLDLTHVILENRHTIGRVQSRLLVPSSLDTEGDAQTRRMQVFGWDMVQRVDGNIMECVFTKEFRGLNVAELMQKTWANDMRLGEFKKVKGETCRLEVLQQVNPNAYVLCRDVISPTNDISIFRSVYVRFLIETDTKVPVATSASADIDVSAPSTLPQDRTASDSESGELKLKARGYVLGTQSIDTDFSKHPRSQDVLNRVAWAHVSLSIEFLNVVNSVTGEEYQQLCWSGRTDYCGEEHAQRNASDMLQGLLRWELLIISPALTLCSLR